jgi:sialate O-acetylesterase
MRGLASAHLPLKVAVMRPAVLLPTLILFAAAIARADVQLPALFSDHLVLQQLKPVPVWGTAAPDEDVSVRFAGQTRVTRTDLDGRWRITLDPMQASAEARDLTVSGKNTITLKNVLVGEVWICSGQSNMQWTVSQAGNPEQEIAAAKFPQVRMFSVERNPAMKPAADVKGAWKEANPDNAGQFSAVAYYFGRHLHQVLKVPVGLINTSWGGTRIEAWTSRESLEERPCAAQLLSDWDGILKSWDGAAENAKFEAAKSEWAAKAKAIKTANAKLAKGEAQKPVPPAPRPPDDPNKTPHFPAVLYNGMIAPLIPYAVQGAIWYQGESNQHRAFQYQELLPNMINDWRTRWNDDFSFYIVQLASYGNRKPITRDAGVADTWAEPSRCQRPGSWSPMTLARRRTFIPRTNKRWAAAWRFGHWQRTTAARRAAHTAAPCSRTP